MCKWPTGLRLLQAQVSLPAPPGAAEGVQQLARTSHGEAGGGLGQDAADLKFQAQVAGAPLFQAGIALAFIAAAWALSVTAAARHG